MKKNLPMIKKFIDLLYLEFISGKSIININIEEIDNNNNKLKIKKLGNINFLEKNKSKENISNKDLPNIYFEKIKIENDLDIHSSLSSSKALPNQEEQKQNKKIINFSFKYINFNNINIEIKNHFVPIWIKKIYKEEILKLDNISILIINKINGINSVENISKEPLSIDLVKYVLYSLYLTEQITFVDLFQHSNIYKPTINLKNIKIEGLFNKFKNFYILNNINDDITNKNIDDHKLFSYYVLLSNSKNVKNFEDKAKDFEINLQLFIAFGVYLGIIRRIHLYFFIKKYANTDDIVSLMDGKHCEDDICVEKGITLEKLKKIYDENKGGDNYYFLYK
jgi:hypothetical protein